jgi:hypothetical protein
MIKITTATRLEYQDLSDTVANCTVSGALLRFLQYELGFGGDVISVEATKVCVRTLLMARVDTTTLEGSEDDMRLIVELAALQKGVASFQCDRIKHLDLPSVAARLRFLHGTIRAKALILFRIGAIEAAEFNVDSIIPQYLVKDKLQDLSFPDLVAVMELVVSGVAFDEAVSLARAQVKYNPGGQACGLREIR